MLYYFNVDSTRYSNLFAANSIRLPSDHNKNDILWVIDERDTRFSV